MIPLKGGRGDDHAHTRIQRERTEVRVRGKVGVSVPVPILLVYFETNRRLKAGSCQMRLIRWISGSFASPWIVVSRRMPTVRRFLSSQSAGRGQYNYPVGSVKE